MTVFILSFIIIAVCMLGLGLSLMCGRGQIKGSCGATDDLPGFEEGDGCSGACASKRGYRPDCEGRRSCQRRTTTQQEQAD